jgi:hypothetical protein
MGVPSLVTSVITATMLVVSPPDGTDGSAYREIGTDNSRISTIRIALSNCRSRFSFTETRSHTTSPIRRSSA